MCSSHNPKKHYFATRQKVCIRFTFVNEDSLTRSFLIDAAQFQQDNCLALTKAILYLNTKGFNVNKYDVFLPQFQNIKVDFEKNQPFIPFQKLPLKQLFLHMLPRKKSQEIQQSSESEPHRSAKEPQRVISDVIQKVRLWRYLFDKKGISLKQAAVLIGVAKKSLDDYFLLLRQGQILGFEYQTNLQSKMGQLRSFIKKHSKKLPHGKLPHEYNNLNCYYLIGNDCAQNDICLKLPNRPHLSHIPSITTNKKHNQCRNKIQKKDTFQLSDSNLIGGESSGKSNQMAAMDLDGNCDYACHFGQSDDDSCQ